MSSIDWQPIKTIPEGKMVLLCGPSGHTNVSHRIGVGYSNKKYRPLEPIRTYNNDAFTDGGPKATHWAHLPNFPKPCSEAISAQAAELLESVKNLQDRLKSEEPITYGQVRAAIKQMQEGLVDFDNTLKDAEGL